MKAVVVITVNDRPEYLKPVIDSWRAVRQIDDFTVVFQVEPNSPSLYLCDAAPFKHKYIVVNREKKGALGNPFAALDTGFDLGAEFVVLGEDDSIVTADALEYFGYAAQAYELRMKCLAVCSFQYQPNGKPHIIYPRHYFASTVWGTWRNRWDQLIRPHWRFDYEPAWDRMLLDMSVREMFCAFPGISRSQHIGQYNGTHMPAERFELLQAKAVHDGSTQQFVALGGDS